MLELVDGGGGGRGLSIIAKLDTGLCFARIVSVGDGGASSYALLDVDASANPRGGLGLTRRGPVWRLGGVRGGMEGSGA